MIIVLFYEIYQLLKSSFTRSKEINIKWIEVIFQPNSLKPSKHICKKSLSQKGFVAPELSLPFEVLSRKYVSFVPVMMPAGPVMDAISHILRYINSSSLNVEFLWKWGSFNIQLL